LDVVYLIYNYFPSIDYVIGWQNIRFLWFHPQKTTLETQQSQTTPHPDCILHLVNTTINNIHQHHRRH
jgi:hypothetical protein